MAQKSRTVVNPREAERRRSLMYKIGAVFALAIIAAGVTFWAVNNNKDAPSTTGGLATPTVIGEDGIIRITKAPEGTEPKAVVTLVEDFQCPGCGSFEEMFGSTIEKLAENPEVAIDYIPISFLNQMSTTDYSTRANNASVCVAEATAKKGDWTVWRKFHALLFENQPAEGGAGLPDSTLISLARDAGAEGITDCINDRQFGKWVADTTAKTTATEGFTGTPWVRVNGQTLNTQGGPPVLEQAVNDALKK